MCLCVCVCVRVCMCLYTCPREESDCIMLENMSPLLRQFTSKWLVLAEISTVISFLV